jgi:hypothetical protein
MASAVSRVLPVLLLPGCLALEPFDPPGGERPARPALAAARGVPALGLNAAPEATSPVEASAAEADEGTPFVPVSRSALLRQWNILRGDAYALDDRERWVANGARVSCDRKSLVSYPGTHLRYQGALLVDPAFKERLARFESVAAEVAREIYGREPRRVIHYGAFSCRSTRNRSRLVSEHAFGNALDLVGFDFAAAKKIDTLAPELPRALKGAFQVRVAKHWAASSGTAATHARFLAELTRRLQERADIFRSMFGPGHGGHDDHLHLDVSPWRYVDL